MLKMILMNILLLSLASPIFAQNKLNESNVKSALSQIFELSKKQEFQKLAPHLLNKDNLKSFNFQNSSDARSVKRISKKIKAYLDLSDSYQYEKLTFETFENFPSAELEVSFKSGDQDLKISFIFIEQSNKILLAKFR